MHGKPGSLSFGCARWPIRSIRQSVAVPAADGVVVEGELSGRGVRSTAATLAKLSWAWLPSVSSRVRDEAWTSIGLSETQHGVLNGERRMGRLLDRRAGPSLF
jgi:hypothetical protein